MRISTIINPNDKHYFEVGVKHIQLIIRDSSNNIELGGDIISNITLSRSDIVNITPFKGEKLYFFNGDKNPVKIEYQLSEVVISIKEQRFSDLDALLIDEIITPVKISEIMTPVKIEQPVAVEVSGGTALEITGAVDINTPDKPIDVNIVGGGGGGGGGDALSVTSSENFTIEMARPVGFKIAENQKGWFIQTYSDSVGVLLVRVDIDAFTRASFCELSAGDSAFLPFSQDISLFAHKYNDEPNTRILGHVTAVY